jgi:WD40 repeat protein
MISVLLLYPFSSPSSILTVDYFGVISIHSYSGSHIVSNKDSRKSVCPKGVRSAVLTPDSSKLAVLSIGGNPYNGTIEIYSVSLTEIKKITQLFGNFKQCEWVNSSDLFVLRENIIDPGDVKVIKQRDRPIPADKVFEDFEEENDEVLDSEELLNCMIYNSKRVVTYYACVFVQVDTQRVGRAQVTDIFTRVNCIQQNYSGIVAFATVGRVVHVMRMESLEMMHSIKLKGSGVLAMVFFSGQNLYFSPSSNYLCKFNTDQSPINQEISTDSHYPFIEIVKTPESWVHKNNFLCWLEPDKSLISLNEYGIFSGTFTDWPNSGQMKDLKHESLFKMTCCGLDIHPTLHLVTVGDFTGTVAVLEYEDNLLVSITQIQGSVRCLKWLGEQVLIGTVEGLLYIWDFQMSEPEIYYSFESTIVCMALKEQVLALGCTNGQLFFMKDREIINTILAHEKQEAEERFGSLGLFSEIWSLAWSPDGMSLATGSEDQSVKIWDVLTLSSTRTLPKHARAVTGVRWEEIKSTEISSEVLSEILVTCSDDESLRIYSPKSWTILFTLNTSVIQEWHTITYTSIKNSGSHVACVTQNGFLFILNLNTLKCEIVERIHNGSIEGLDWKDQLITCSSEGLCCVVSLD